MRFVYVRFSRIADLGVFRRERQFGAHSGSCKKSAGTGLERYQFR
jgi:hypothetical protein